MAVLPPITKPPFTIDSISGAQIIPLSNPKKIVLFENNQAGTQDLLVEFPIGAGFVTHPAGAKIEIEAMKRFAIGVAIGTIKTAAGSISLVWEETA